MKAEAQEPLKGEEQKVARYWFKNSPCCLYLPHAF